MPLSLTRNLRTKNGGSTYFFIFHQYFSYLYIRYPISYSHSHTINTSVIQVLEPGFVEGLLGMISDLGLNPENLSIELTESVFVQELSEINNVTFKLRAAGIKVEIDDFGTGYSSIGRERDLLVDCMKIDKSFIDRLKELKPDKAITGDIISIAHKLGHCVVAEGVEFEEQLNYLRVKGCDRVQGYLFSKPLDEDCAIEFLANQENILSLLQKDF